MEVLPWLCLRADGDKAVVLQNFRKCSLKAYSKVVLGTLDLKNEISPIRVKLWEQKISY